MILCIHIEGAVMGRKDSILNMSNLSGSQDATTGRDSLSRQGLVRVAAEQE
jgi:hypothetical protein